MTISRSEDVLVGLVSLALVPWIAWTLRRGLREDKLPIGRAYVSRAERPSAFRLMLALYIAMALLAAFISIDLLFNLNVRSWL